MAKILLEYDINVSCHTCGATLEIFEQVGGVLYVKPCTFCAESIMVKCWYCNHSFIIKKKEKHDYHECPKCKFKGSVVL
jgi:hypothetical protein